MYKEMTPGELNNALGMDGKKWADAFMEFTEENPSLAKDHGTMLSWFCNAIMSGYDNGHEVGFRRGLREKREN